MFTQPCFIRKNTPELRKKLEELGYKIINSGNTTLDAHNFDGKDNHRHIDEGTTIITSYGHYYGVVYYIDNIVKRGRIDCSTNEDLFLALAALNDDSDYMQWFCSDEPNFDDRCFFVCQCKTLNEHIQGDRDWDVSTYHKATVEELIEHFKNK